MFRLILAASAIVLFLLLTLPVLLLLWIMEKSSPRRSEIIRLRMVQWIFRVITWLCGTKVTVIGEENIPKDQPVLYIGNHRSLFDTPLTYARCPSYTGYIAKKEMEKVPILNLWMKGLHCLFLDREDIKEGLKIILTAIDYIKAGVSITVFPEGTRGKDPDETKMQPFHEGTFKIATKTGCPIIPMAISHSSQIFEDHKPWIRSAHVIIEYGAPIYPNQLSKEEKKFIGKYVQKIMQEMLDKNVTI